MEKDSRDAFFMHLRDEGKKAVLHVKQSHLYLKKKKKDISRLLSLKHNTAGEKFGVLVKKKNQGNI